MDSSSLRIVCAGSFQQFCFWCREQGINPKNSRAEGVIYASRPEVLMGIHEPVEVIRYGTYWENLYLHEIEEEIRIIESCHASSASADG